MKNLHFPIWLAFILALPGCSRDFKPPPAEVVIDGFSPSHGFKGDVVGICGQNFDSNAGTNIVHFGTEVAEIVDEENPAGYAPDPAFTCEHVLLFAKVPGLESAGEVSVNVSSPAGQAVHDTPFVYDGPGHPVHEHLKKLLDVRTGLWSVFTPTESKTLIFGTMGLEASTVGIFESFFGLHLDFGVCGLPLSAAFGSVSDRAFALVGTRMHIGREDLAMESDIFSWTVNVDDIQQLIFADPEFWLLPEVGGKPFAPHLVWSIPRPAPDQSLHDFVVTHLRFPVLAIVSPQDPANPVVVELPDESPVCSNSDDDRLGPIVDMAYDSREEHIYLALAGTNEVWRVNRDGTGIRRMFPPPTYNPDEPLNVVRCTWSNAAMALRRSQDDVREELRLYISDQSQMLVTALKLSNPGPDEVLVQTVYFSTFDSIPYSLATARYSIPKDIGTDPGERLYVATQSGMRVFDVSKGPLQVVFQLVGEIPVPVNNGGVQSLAIAYQWDPLFQVADEVLLVDSANARVLRYAAGEENFPRSETATGSVASQFATSHDDGRFFVADSLSNAIHIVDRNSGLRTAQFPIVALGDHPTMGFLSLGMTTMHREDHDLLMVPLVRGQILGDLSARYRAIAFGRIGEEAPICGLTQGGLMVDRNLDRDFHEMQLVSWPYQEQPGVPVLVLSRYFDKTDDSAVLGETWCVELDPDGSGADGIVRESLSFCDHPGLADFGPGVRLVRSARNAPYITVLEELPAGNGNEDPALGIRMIDLVSGEFSEDVMDAELAPYLFDALVVSPLDRSEPVVQVYMTMGELGMVLVGTFHTTGNMTRRVIPTGGDPTFLSLSPDGRRVYVSHFFSNQVSVIGTDCEPAGRCEGVEATIDVDAWPGPVVFDDTGETAFLMHYKSSDISWLE